MAENKKNLSYTSSVGRRKAAVARVRLYPKVPDNLMIGDQLLKKGEVVVNGKEISAYFKSNVAKIMYEKPFQVTNTLNKFGISIRVTGGGQNSQLDATILAISRALSGVDSSFKEILRKKGLLTVDQKVRERRKVGTGGKARRTKQSPKR
ncbi:MAG: 30S ribosomal protein S9 [Candidatus Levybacteria bacterium]|nr:30S ribosomal protein S9 [Candidatus Levybacteria bacterium]MBI2421131.1 30S ribosomal protein S9 [Candidatus Levybacteria bacterium]